MESTFTSKRKSLIALGSIATTLFCFASLNSDAQQITNFNYTGSVQTYTVPNGVTSILVDVYGAQGGSAYYTSSYGTGGLGGHTQGTLVVTPGEVLQIYTAGVGANSTYATGGAGGYNGGANGGDYTDGQSGGGGGGASDVRRTPYSLNDRIIVGGGGGGAASCSASAYDGGVGGGLVGGTAPISCGTPSQYSTGGTQSAGGQGGIYAGWCSAPAGTFGSGGVGCVPSGGGGAGGGYYGGGGGSWMGGGGGSSFTNGTVSGVTHTQGVRTGNGLVVITILFYATVTQSSQILCNGQSNGSLTATPNGGVGPYSYSWAPTGGNSATATGLAAGTYTVTITDSNSSIASQTFTITEPTVLSASSSATSILCNGGNSTVTVISSGGTSPYTGTGAFTQTAGTYSYTVTDNNGCTSTTSITITQPTALVANASSTAILCNGGNATVTVAATGGTSPYTGDGSFTETAGTYSYMVTDANGCTSTTSITLTEPTAISTSIITVDATCSGGSDGSIDITVTGGTGPYTYDWNSGAFTTEDLTGIPAGAYVGIVTDANGCTDGGTITINEPTPIVISAVSTTNPSTCGGTDGAIDISVSGGSPGYTYLWNTSDTTDDVTNLGAGSYDCTVTDTNGCTATYSADLLDPAAPAVTLSLAASIICLDDASMTLSGASPLGGTYSGTGVTANSFNPMTAGVGAQPITYTYTDSLGCSSMASDTITVSPCTGIESNSDLTGFTIFPNPNNGEFTFIQNSKDAVDVLIYDAIGQLVNSFVAKSGVTQQLNIEISGMYTITIVSADGNRISQRVLVSK